MFKKKKQEELSDQYAVYQQRQSPRWGTPKYNIDAGVTIKGYEGEGQLGNISVSGCSMLSVTYVNVTPGELYDVSIIPGKTDSLKPFNLKLRLSWTKSSEDVFQAGFSLEGREGSNNLKTYAEILRARGIEPDYGNMQPDSKNG